MSTKSDSVPSKDARSPPATSKETDIKQNEVIKADPGSSSTKCIDGFPKEPPSADEKAKLTASRSMFDDVDGKNATKGDVEIVDMTFEGIAEIDGVPHFICQGECDDFKLELQVTKLD